MIWRAFKKINAIELLASKISASLMPKSEMMGGVFG